MSRQDSQLRLPPTLLTKHSSESAVLTKSESAPDHSRIAAQLFDTALTDSRLTSAEAAHLIGVSENMVNRMRSPNYRECVSLVQLLKCGPVVVWHFHCALHAHEKFQQRALRDAMQALSLLAVGAE